MIWLAIRLTQLPLEALNIERVMQNTPYGVVENSRIICINSSAKKLGIKINQTISTAYALCDELQLKQRSLAQEKQKLNDLALLVYQFSPSVCIENSHLLLVEIGASLKLYINLENLIDLLKAELINEISGFKLGLGNTPKSAELSSFVKTNKSLSNTPFCNSNSSKNNFSEYSFMHYWRTDEQIINIKLLEKNLSELSVAALPIPLKTLNQINSVGIKTIKALKQLPQKSITKRFGKTLSTYLLKLDAQLGDPKDFFRPQEFFFQKVEFIDVVHHRHGLLFPIRRLIKSLCRFLTVKQQNSQTLHWELFDSEKNHIGFEVLISDNQINPKTYFELTQLTLERYVLHAPIEAISLKVEKLSTLSVQTNSLLESSQEFEQNSYFINKIRAKLGQNRCLMINKGKEDLPELSYRLDDDFSSNQPALNESNSSKSTLDKNNYPPLSKPSWLLEEPQPILYSQRRLIWKGELKIISSQERVTSYWWKKKVARDYFLAKHDNGTIYWVYFEKIKRQWFIHGIYS